MALTAITSPWTGARVDVLPDADWLELAGWQGQTGRLGLHMARLTLLRTLWETGPAEESQGRASAILYERMTARGYGAQLTALAALMLDVGPAVETVTRGKRRFRIALGILPEHWARRLMELPASAPVEASAPAPAPVEPPEAPEPLAAVLEASAAPLEAMAPTLEVAGIVAMELLTRVVEIVSTGTAPDRASGRLREERDDARRRLAEALDYGENLRRDIRKLERERETQASEVKAMRLERDGLRERLRSTEANLTAALRGDAAAYVNGEVAKAINDVMRVREPASA